MCSVYTRLPAGAEEAPIPIGCPKALSETSVDDLAALLDKMVGNADATREVSMDMLMRRGRVKACIRAVADALHARGATLCL